MNNLTILGIFYEGYKDLWIDFISLFKRNWPDCPFSFFVVSNSEKEENVCGVKVLNAGLAAEYSLKIQTALKSITTDYVLVLLEDFFFSKIINTNEIISLLTYIVDNEINYYAMPMEGFANNYKGKKIIGRKGERFISDRAEYTLSCQPSIWKKDFLNKCIGTENYNAWVFEGIFSNINKKLKHDLVQNCVVNVNNPLSLVHGVIQGKIIPAAYTTLKSSGYILQSNREMLSGKELKKISIKIKLRSCLPYFLQSLVKKVLKPKTVFRNYKTEIDLIIKNRWGT